MGAFALLASPFSDIIPSTVRAQPFPYHPPPASPSSSSSSSTAGTGTSGYPYFTTAQVQHVLALLIADGCKPRSAAHLWRYCLMALNASGGIKELLHFYQTAIEAAGHTHQALWAPLDPVFGLTICPQVIGRALAVTGDLERARQYHNFLQYSKDSESIPMRHACFASLFFRM
jgi:hypothetical protein